MCTFYCKRQQTWSLETLFTSLKVGVKEGMGFLFARQKDNTEITEKNHFPVIVSKSHSRPAFTSC